jgi:hypothetical protein
LSTAIDRQEQKDLIKKGQSGIATSINLILNRMAIAILPPLKQFLLHGVTTPSKRRYHQGHSPQTPLKKW